uniref:Transposase n=1 Tax=Heterorhabditis bacteriophora TaxID=37862 RepID=A0A1I7W7K3_HETBA
MFDIQDMGIVPSYSPPDGVFDYSISRDILQLREWPQRRVLICHTMLDDASLAKPIINILVIREQHHFRIPYTMLIDAKE